MFGTVPFRFLEGMRFGKYSKEGLGRKRATEYTPPKMRAGPIAAIVTWYLCASPKEQTSCPLLIAGPSPHTYAMCPRAALLELGFMQQGNRGQVRV